MKGISLLLLLLSSCSSYEHNESERIMQESLRQCYVESDSYTGMRGSVQGSMTALLDVNVNGKITRCRIQKNDFKDPNLTACVCDVFKRSVLPHDKGKNIEVSQPVNFKQAEQ